MDYEKLQKKYELPSYEKLSTYFYLDDPESLIDIQNAMKEKYDSYAKIIETIVQPETNLANMYEAHYIDVPDRKTAYGCFKTMMHMLRYHALVQIKNDESEQASFIKRAYEEWDSMHKELSGFMKKLTHIWEMETNIKEDLSYFG